MKLKHLTLLSLLITTQSWGSVKAYFNYNQSASYTDPYRKIARQGDNLEQVILTQIASAKKTIYVAVQELRLPLVAKALAAKKAQGVDVRVVLEHDYNFTVIDQRQGQDNEHEATRLTDLIALVDTNRDGRASKAELEANDAVYILKAAGIPVIDDTSDGSSGSGLMHHKFMIVDGKSVLVSSANFTLSCIHGDILAPATRGNANSMMVLNSVAAADIFTEEFGQLWGNGKRGNFDHSKTYRGAQSVIVAGSRVTIQFSPTSQRYQWSESTNGLMAKYLNAAKQTIAAALFVYTDQKLSNVIEARSNAGVRTGFLVDAKFAFRDYSELLDMAGLAMYNQKCNYEPDNKPWKKPAAEIGVPQLPRGDMLHHKFAVVDNRYTIMGSQNWSDAANYINDETSIVVENPTISAQYTKEYLRLRSTSRMGVPATVQNEIKRLNEACVGRAF